MAQWLYSKDPNMKYTDLCIFIDNNFYSDKPDYDTCFKYMWILAVMLATKGKYFNTVKDYEDFAFELALDTYKRMIDPEKTQIKSVLNYMKSIIVFRKMAFIDKTSQKIIDQNFDKCWDPVQYKENVQRAMESTNREKVLEYLCEVVKTIPSEVKKSIPRVYRQDKVVYENLYISSMLTLLNKFTLSNEDEKLLQERLNNPNFNELKFYANKLSDDIILWHLGPSMEGVVRLVNNKVTRYIIENIREISSSLSLSDEDFNNILYSAYGEGDTNDSNF